MTTTTKHRLPAESLTALRDHADRALRLNPVVPATFAATFARISTELLAAASARNIRTVAGLHSQWHDVIKDVCGLAAPTDWTPSEDRAVFHEHRNVLLTILVAAYLSTRPSGTREQPDPVDLIPAVKKPRSAEPDRAMTDDEIALARAWALVASRYPQKRYAAAIYTLCDAGLRLAEAPLLRRSDLVGDQPEMVLAGGTQRRAARFLALEPFHRQVLGTVTDPSSVGGADDLLLHRSRGSKDERNSGEAAATRTLTSFFSALGLRHADVVPASAARWRIKHCWATEGLDAAVAAAGTTREAVESELGITRALKSRTPVATPRASVAAM